MTTRNWHLRHNKALIISGALLLGACGASGAGETAESSEAPGTTEAAIPETTVTTPPTTATPTTAQGDVADAELWITAVGEKHQALQKEFFRILIEEFSVEVQTDDTLIPLVNFWRAQATAADSFADELNDPPPGFALVEPTKTFAEAVRAFSQASRDTSADAEDDPILQGSLVDVEEVASYGDRQREAGTQLELACFAFQETVADLGLALVDCVGASDDQPSEPTTGPEGEAILELGGYDELAPAVYSMPNFAIPFSFELQGETRIAIFENDIILAPSDDEGPLEFYIVAPTEIAKPGEPFGAATDLIPMPADLGEWLAANPLGIESTGTTLVSGVEVPYWTLNSTEELGPDDFWDFVDFPDSPQRYGVRQGATFWQIPHPDGDLVVYGLPKPEIPDSATPEEFFAYMESIVSTINLNP